MTSRGRRFSQSPVVTALPKGEPRHRILAQKKWSVSVSIRSIPVLRLPLNARACRPKVGWSWNGLPGTSLPPCGRGGRAQRGRRANNGQRPIGKCWHLRRQMTSRGRKVLSVTCGDSSPKGRAKASYIGTRNGAYLYRYCFHSLFYGYPSMRVPPESRMVVKTVSVPAPLASPCGRGGRAQRGRRGQITATSNRKMLAPSQADDVPRAQGPLSHLR